MITDEVQSSLARSGKMLACDWEEVRPDVVVSTSHPLQNLSLQILYNFHDFYQVLDVNVETFWIMMFTWTIKLQYDCKLHQENYPCSIPLICQEDMTFIWSFSPLWIHCDILFKYLYKARLLSIDVLPTIQYPYQIFKFKYLVTSLGVEMGGLHLMKWRQCVCVWDYEGFIQDHSQRLWNKSFKTLGTWLFSEGQNLHLLDLYLKVKFDYEGFTLYSKLW